MKQSSEQQLDAVLAALRDTNPLHGMEQRVLQAVQARATAKTVAHPIQALSFLQTWIGPLAWRTFVAVGLSFAAIAVILLTKVLAPLPPHIPTTQQTSPNLYIPAPLPGNQTAKTGSPSAPAITSGLQKTRLIPGAEPPANAVDLMALEDTNAPSHPAPPMPLTTQERLLLRSTRRGQPLEIAQLEPMREVALRHTVEAHEQSQLQQYVQALLGPLALSEAIDPTPPSPEPDSLPEALATEPDPDQP